MSDPDEVNWEKAVAKHNALNDQQKAEVSLLYKRVEGISRRISRRQYYDACAVNLETAIASVATTFKDEVKDYEEIMLAEDIMRELR